MRKLIVALALALALVACGSGYTSIDAAIEGEQCEVLDQTGPKMFAEDEVHCADGTLISWHVSDRDRNAYADFLEGFMGVTPDEQGANYNIYRG